MSLFQIIIWFKYRHVCKVSRQKYISTRINNFHQMKVDAIISKLVAMGADLSTRNAVQRALSLISEDGDLVDHIYIAVKNRAYYESFSKIPVYKRAVFLPACLRDKNCEAELTEEGYICQKCGRCVIAEIIENAENLEYREIYIVPGGSLVTKILKDKVKKGAC